MLSKILVGLGMAAVLGLMGAGIAYAVAGPESDGRTGEGGGGRWSTLDAAGTGGRWAAVGSADDGWTEQGGETGGRWSGERALTDEPQAALGEPVTLSGVVESLVDSELVLRTDTGELVDVALGQAAYWEAKGVPLPVGEPVVIEGYYEDDDTLAANSVTLVATGQTIVLRDASGRPMWSGGRRNAGAEAAPAF
jgi:hypothetical protein